MINSPAENGNIKKDVEQRNFCVRCVIFPLASINVSLLARTRRLLIVLFKKSTFEEDGETGQKLKVGAHVSGLRTNGKASAGCPAFRNQ